MEERVQDRKQSGLLGLQRSLGIQDLSSPEEDGLGQLAFVEGQGGPAVGGLLPRRERRAQQLEEQLYLGEHGQLSGQAGLLVDGPVAEFY